MNTDDIKGKAEEATGVLTDDDLEREGRRDQQASEAKDKLRDAENWAEEKVDDLRERVDRDT